MITTTLKAKVTDQAIPDVELLLSQKQAKLLSQATSVLLSQAESLPFNRREVSELENLEYSMSELLMILTNGPVGPVQHNPHMRKPVI